MCLAPRPPRLALGGRYGPSEVSASRKLANLRADTRMARSCYAEPVPAGERGGGCPRREPELPEDVGDVAIDGVLAENQPLRDVAIGEAFRNQREHLEFASAQSAERSFDRGGGKPHCRVLDFPEHCLAARPLSVCSHLPKVGKCSLELAACAILVSECRQRCGEIEPHAPGFIAGIARREEVESVLERAPRGVVVALCRRQRSFGGKHRRADRPRLRTRRDPAELAQRTSGALVLTLERERPDCQLESDASLDPSRLGEAAEIAISEVCRLRRLVPVKREGAASEQREGVRLAACE